MSAGAGKGEHDAWQLAKEFLGGGFAFGEVGQMKNWMRDPDWLNKAVEDAMQQAMPESNKQSVRITDYSIAETARSVVVKMPISARTNPYSLRLYVSPNRLRVAGLPGGKERTVLLPREVTVVGVRAVCKENTLVVRMPRRNVAGKERQINILVE